MYNNARILLKLINSGGEEMEHKKTYYTKELETANGTLIIEGPISG